MSDMPKAYEPDIVEQKLYSFWMDKGYFTPVIDRSKKPFVIIMPPPNVTGGLHVGHALTAVLEDVVTRWHRMLGDPTLWLPGVDHAGIATQVIVEHKLAAEGIDRHQLGREKFIERVWEWVAEARKEITYQHKRLGISCDWSRERFTLDEGPALAVRTAFVRLFEKGLIYQGERIINWCPRCRTALSDLEVQHKDITGNLYYMRYPFADGSGYITVATTRPETYLGDTAVAVNPDDNRYQGMAGKEIRLPVIDRVIPVIADSAVDPSFGTGAVKITPAHDPVDFEMSQRQNLPIIHIMNPDATMNAEAGPYEGMDRIEARKKIIEDFEQAGLLEKVEPHAHAVGHCFRCSTMVEPNVSRQWFVKMEPLAKKAIEVVTNGSISIIPERFNKIYFNWMENIRDWCISRQLWWGHRIPVWYCRQCGQVIAAIEDPAECPACRSSELVQDPDVLDTWFSSGLWPHSTLGWPEQTEDLDYFYPTSVMVTGYDILFFWVARMIMMGIEDTGDIPFRDVYLNGLIRDEKGEKMSKMKGNVLDPVGVIEKYGTDALRFALTTGTTPGNDINLGQHRLEAGRNFANKLWNAARFVLQNIEDGTLAGEQLLRYTTKVESLEDRWILSRLSRLVSKVETLMEGFQFGEAEQEIHDFFWNEYCDWYIEIAKLRLTDRENSPLPVLAAVLEVTLRLLHPFMPFITEELWQNLKDRLPQGALESEALIVATYPSADKQLINPEADSAMEAIIEIVRAIRNARAEYKVPQTKWIEANIYTDTLSRTATGQSAAIETLARAKPLSILRRDQRSSEGERALVIVLGESEVVLPWADIVDIEAEKARLEKEISVLEREIARLEGRLGDEAFINKAPAHVVEKERSKLDSYRDKIGRLQQEIAQL